MSSPEQTVRNAYQWILGREVDPSGLQTYLPQVKDGTLSKATLRQELIRSAEFQAKAPLQAFNVGHNIQVVVDPTEPQIGQRIADSGQFEPHTVELIRSQLRPGDVFVDIGANVGMMAFHAASVVGDQGKVIAFEPIHANADCLLRGQALNGFFNIELHIMALGDSEGVLFLNNLSNAEVVATDHPLQPGLAARSVIGDRMLAHEPRIDFVKMDIEGFEPFALRGLRESLSQHKPMVLAEFSPHAVRHHGQLTIEDYAELVFAMTSNVECFDYASRKSHASSASELLTVMAEVDQRASGEGIMEPGKAHIDILFRVER